MAKKQVSVSLRKPPSPEAVDTFVTSGATEVAATKAAPAPKRSRGKKQVAAEKTAVMEAPPVASTPAPPSVAPVPESGTRETAAARAAEAAPTIEMPAPEVTPAPPAVVASAPEEPTPVTAVEVTALPPPIMGPNGLPMRPVTIYLPQNLAEKLTVFCIQQDRDLSNVIGEALENHLSPRLGPGTPPPSSDYASAGPRDAYAPPPPHAGRPFWMPEAVWMNPRVEKMVGIGRAVLGVLRRHGYAG